VTAAWWVLPVILTTWVLTSENSKFSARVQYNYRSKFLNGLDRNSAIYQDAVGTISASLGYNPTDNISLTLEGKD
jgi:iron complex outermembrane receptor protein